MNASPFILIWKSSLTNNGFNCICTAVFLPLTCKNLSDSNTSLLMSKVIACIILAHVIISPYKDLYLLQNPYNWREIFTNTYV